MLAGIYRLLERRRYRRPAMKGHREGDNRGLQIINRAIERSSPRSSRPLQRSCHEMRPPCVRAGKSW